MKNWFTRSLMALALMAVVIAAPPNTAGAETIAEAETLEQVLAASDYDQQKHGAVLRLYQAFFAREPDVAGARYWLELSDSNTLTNIADAFTASDEYQNAYGGNDDATFLTNVYDNVLGRTFDQAGFDYWLDTLRGTDSSGANPELKKISRGELVRWVSASPEFVSAHPYTAMVEPPDPDGPEVGPVTVPPPGATITGVTPCPEFDGSSERVTGFAQAPPGCIDPTAQYEAVLSTTKGTIVVDLDTLQAPVTVNNFVVLALYHFYDGVAFHRVIPEFVVQGGDAVGPTPGVGNPGYWIDDELPEPNPFTGRSYTYGSIAMANSGANTNGSQFFFVSGADGAVLPGDYSRFGQIRTGRDVLAEIDAVGTVDGAPSEVVRVTGVEIRAK